MQIQYAKCLIGRQHTWKKKKRKRIREVFAAFAADSPQTKSVNVKMPKLIAVAAPWIKLQATARLQAASAARELPSKLPYCHAAVAYGSRNGQPQRQAAEPVGAQHCPFSWAP